MSNNGGSVGSLGSHAQPRLLAFDNYYKYIWGCATVPTLPTLPQLLVKEAI